MAMSCTRAGGERPGAATPRVPLSRGTYGHELNLALNLNSAGNSCSSSHLTRPKPFAVSGTVCLTATGPLPLELLTLGPAGC